MPCCTKVVTRTPSHFIRICRWSYTPSKSTMARKSPPWKQQFPHCNLPILQFTVVFPLIFPYSPMTSPAIQPPYFVDLPPGWRIAAGRSVPWYAPRCRTGWRHTPRWNWPQWLMVKPRQKPGFWWGVPSIHIHMGIHTHTHTHTHIYIYIHVCKHTYISHVDSKANPRIWCDDMKPSNCLDNQPTTCSVILLTVASTTCKSVPHFWRRSEALQLKLPMNKATRLEQLAGGSSWAQIHSKPLLQGFGTIKNALMASHRWIDKPWDILGSDISFWMLRWDIIHVS